MAKIGNHSVQNSLRFTPSFKTSIRHELLALCTIVLTVLAVRFQAIIRLGTHYIGGSEGDAGLYIWLSQHFGYNTLKLPLFETQAFYPYSETLAWSDNFILPALMVSLFRNLGCSHVIAYNLLFLICFLLNGYLTFRLAFRLTGKLAVALFPAVAVVSLSLLSSQLGHPQNQFIFFFPLLLLSIFEFLGSESVIWAMIAGLTITATFLTTVYYSIFLCVVSTSVIFITALLRPAKFKWSLIFKLAIGAFLGIAPILFFIRPYLDVKHAFGGRQIHEAYFFAVGLTDYFSAYKGSLIYGALSDLGSVESNFFPGLLVLGLACAAILKIFEAKKPKRSFLGVLCTLFVFAILGSVRPLGWLGSLCACIASWLVVLLFAMACLRFGRLERSLDCHYLSNRDLSLIFAAIALVFFVLSFGSLGNPATSEWTLGIYRIFYELFPGFDSIRAVSRSGIVVVYALLLLATMGLTALLSNRFITERVCLVFLPIVLLENLCLYYPLQPLSFSPTVINQLSSLLKANESIVILPMATRLNKAGAVDSWSDYATLNVNYMNWVRPTNALLVNGYSGQRSHAILNYPRWLHSFPDEQSKKVLAGIPGLKYLLYASKNDPDRSLEQIISSAQKYSWLKFISADDQGNILFKLQIESVLTPDFTILVPSRPNLALHLELSTNDEAGSPQELIEVLCNGSPISNIKLESNSSWQQFSLLLPINDTKVRPSKIQFQVNTKRNIVARSIMVSPIEPTP